MVFAVLIGLVVLVLLTYFDSAQSRRRGIETQAGGVTDHDPIPDQRPAKGAPAISAIGVPAQVKGTTPQAAQVDARPVPDNPSVENPVDAKRLNPMGLTGFILGLCSVMLYPIGILPVLATIFSGIGMGTFKPEAQKHPWMAYVGLGLGILYTIMKLSGN